MAERLREASSDFKSELESKEKFIAELRNKIDQLQSEIAAKDEEIKVLHEQCDSARTAT